MKLLKRALKLRLREKHLTLNFEKLFPTDNIAGDHHYQIRDYYLLGRLFRLEISHKIVNEDNLVISGCKIKSASQNMALNLKTIDLNNNKI